MDTENAEEAGTSWSHLGNAFLEADHPSWKVRWKKMNQEYVLSGPTEAVPVPFPGTSPPVDIQIQGHRPVPGACAACLVTSYWSSWTTEGASLKALIFLPPLPQMQPAYRKSDQTWVAKWLLEGTRFGWARAFLWLLS